MLPIFVISMVQQRILPASFRGIFSRSKPKVLVEPVRSRHREIAELRGKIEWGNISSVCIHLLQNPDQIKYVFGALIDSSQDLSKHAEMVITRLAQSKDPVIRTHIEAGLSNFLDSPWIRDNATNLSAIELRIRMNRLYSHVSSKL